MTGRRLIPSPRPLVGDRLARGISSVTLSVQARMQPHLDDATTLAARSRRTVVLACALTAAVLAPSVDLVLFQGAMSNGLDPSLRDIFAYVVWAPVMAGTLGGLVAHLALRTPARARLLATLGFAAAAGVLQLGLLLLATLPSALIARGPGGLDVLGPAVMIGIFGSIVSAPMGGAFGLLFLVSTSAASRSIEAPSHDGPAWVSCAAAAQLAIATCVAVAVLRACEGPYCQALFVVALPSLGVALPEGSDLAWTRYLLASPLALGAVIWLVRGLWSHVALARSVRALLRDAHPRWRLTRTEASLDLVVPLRARDRARRVLEVVAREGVAPYRGSTAAIAALSEDA